MDARTILDYISEKRRLNEKIFVLLIDPGKFTSASQQQILNIMAETPPDMIFVGGSQFDHSIEAAVNTIRQRTRTPIVMFPGNCNQFSENVDGILFLSLLSGRNPEYLIEQQIRAAQKIKTSGIETIPTGYILIDGGIVSAVETVSQTKPYPSDNIKLITDTAIAAELMGNKLIYLEAGSGAKTPISQEIISSVRAATNIPLIVGGGLRSKRDIQQALTSGADIIVVGNHLEHHPKALTDFINATKKSKNQNTQNL